MKNYSIDKQGLWDILEAWDPFMPRKVRLVACGGTALYEMNPEKMMKNLGYLLAEFKEG